MSSEATLLGRNPFIGPDPLRRGQKIHGRDREIRELFYLLAAERIVWLHSPSGAGKTSLVQAGLIPRLLADGFEVWPTVRVGWGPAAGAEGNRYVLSALTSLEEELPEDERTPLEELARLTLAEYLGRQRRRREESASVGLLFDQFEEVLTAEPLDREAKRHFFEQLGDALRDSRLWALFALREDYLAPLDPYVDLIPLRMSHTFRLDLLSLEAAQAAIVETSREGGREFPAAEQLVHDLATVQVQQPDGSFRRETGHHVEPVQLQVSCRRLWDEMPEDDLSIDPEDLERFGDVTESLGAYYADSVARVADGDRKRERVVRDWFGQQLITANGIRGHVLMGADKSQELGNEVLAQLLDTHLVRTEKRAGATWYELAHDRLIEPILTSNRQWRLRHLSPFVLAAQAWKEAKEDSNLLYSGAELAEAQAVMKADPGEYSELEHEFLRRSVERTTTRRRRRQLATLIPVAFLLAISTGVSIYLYMKARQATKVATARYLAAVSPSLARDHLDRALLLSVEATRMLDSVETRNSLIETLNVKPRLRPYLHGHEGAVLQMEFNGDGSELRSTALDNTVRRWNIPDRKAVDTLSFGIGEVTAVAMAFDAEIAAWVSCSQEGDDGGCDKRGVQIRNLGKPQELGESLAQGNYATGAILSQDGGLLAVSACLEPKDDDGGCAARGVRILDLKNRRWLTESLGRQNHEVGLLAFSPDGTLLAVSVCPEPCDDRLRSEYKVELWKVTEAEAPVLTLPGHERGASSVAFAPSGVLLVSGDGNGSVRLWEIASGKELDVLERLHIGSVQSLALIVCPQQPGSRTLCLASGGSEGIVHLRFIEPSSAEYEFSTDKPPEPLTGVGGAVRSLAWGPRGRSLAVGGESGTISIWNVFGSKNQLDGKPIMEGRLKELKTVAFHPGGELLAVGGCLRRTDQCIAGIELWNLKSEEPAGNLEGHTERVTTIAFSPTEPSRLASGSGDGRVWVWNIDTWQRQPLNGYLTGVESVAFSPDGRMLAAGGTDSSLHRWWLEGSVPRALPPVSNAHLGEVETVTFLRDGELLISGGDDGVIRFWRPQSEEEKLQPLFELVGHIGSVLSIASNPDGETLASAGRDGTVRLWDLKKREPLGEPLTGHTDRVRTVAFSADSKTLASAGDDGTVRLWVVAERRPLRELRMGYQTTVTSVAFHPEGGSLAAAADDGTIRLWAFGASELIDQACRLANRALTKDEWRQYLEGSAFDGSTCDPSSLRSQQSL